MDADLRKLLGLPSEAQLRHAAAELARENARAQSAAAGPAPDAAFDPTEPSHALLSQAQLDRLNSWVRAADAYARRAGLQAAQAADDERAAARMPPGQARSELAATAARLRRQAAEAFAALRREHAEALSLLPRLAGRQLFTADRLPAGGHVARLVSDARVAALGLGVLPQARRVPTGRAKKQFDILGHPHRSGQFPQGGFGGGPTLAEGPGPRPPRRPDLGRALERVWSRIDELEQKIEWAGRKAAEYLRLMEGVTDLVRRWQAEKRLTPAHMDEARTGFNQHARNYAGLMRAQARYRQQSAGLRARANALMGRRDVIAEREQMGGQFSPEWLEKGRQYEWHQGPGGGDYVLRLGKYAGRPLHQVPVEYLLWLSQGGWKNEEQTLTRTEHHVLLSPVTYRAPTPRDPQKWGQTVQIVRNYLDSLEALDRLAEYYRDPVDPSLDVRKENPQAAEMEERSRRTQGFLARQEQAARTLRRMAERVKDLRDEAQRLEAQAGGRGRGLVGVDPEQLRRLAAGLRAQADAAQQKLDAGRENLKSVMSLRALPPRDRAAAAARYQRLYGELVADPESARKGPWELTARYRRMYERRKAALQKLGTPPAEAEAVAVREAWARQQARAVTAQEAARGLLELYRNRLLAAGASPEEAEREVQKARRETNYEPIPARGRVRKYDTFWFNAVSFLEDTPMAEGGGGEAARRRDRLVKEYERLAADLDQDFTRTLLARLPAWAVYYFLVRPDRGNSRGAAALYAWLKGEKDSPAPNQLGLNPTLDYSPAKLQEAKLAYDRERVRHDPAYVPDLSFKRFEGAQAVGAWERAVELHEELLDLRSKSKVHRDEVVELRNKVLRTFNNFHWDPQDDFFMELPAATAREAEVAAAMEGQGLATGGKVRYALDHPAAVVRWLLNEAEIFLSRPTNEDGYYMETLLGTADERLKAGATSRLEAAMEAGRELHGAMASHEVDPRPVDLVPFPEELDPLTPDPTWREWGRRQPLSPDEDEPLTTGRGTRDAAPAADEPGPRGVEVAGDFSRPLDTSPRPTAAAEPGYTAEDYDRDFGPPRQK